MTKNLHRIYIEHNPFLCETIFKLDGNQINDNTNIGNYKHQPLQYWVENIFYDFYIYCNKSNNFEVIFKGIETDYQDILLAIKNAQDEGINVKEKQWIKATSAESRLSQLATMVQSAKENPILNKNLTEDIERRLNDAFDKNFDVYVAATMSAGKSTFINSILGYDLLPAANEATTATIAEIYDNKSIEAGSFIAQRINRHNDTIDKQQTINLELLKDWNKREDTKVIKIEGNISSIQERPNVRLVITDTPGPNNSQDSRHQQVTENKIADSLRNPLIIYILNATQLGINDDRLTLKSIAENMNKGGKQSKDRFIFVVNKMDTFDPEKGEDVKEALNNVKSYLVNCGIEHPIVYPISANLARLIRLNENKVELTRSDRNELRKLEELFEAERSMNLPTYMPLSSLSRSKLNESNIDENLKRSGVPAVEMMIDEYIDRYNLPNRVNRAYKALYEAVGISREQEMLETHLKTSETEQQQIELEIENLQAKVEEALKHIATLEEKNKTSKVELPKAVEDKIADYRSYIVALISDFSHRFKSSKVDKDDADRAIEKLEKELQSEYQKMSANFTIDIEEASSSITKELLNEYKKMIEDLFSDVDKLNLPILSSAKLNMEFTNFDMSLDSYTDSGHISNKTWYKPWTWLKDDTYYKHINLDKFWKDKELSIKQLYDNLLGNYRAEIEKRNSTLRSRYYKFAKEQFDQKFTDLMNYIKKSLSDKSSIEEKISQAKEKLEIINKFNADLEKVLDL